jgi:accessory gene regulator B
MNKKFSNISFLIHYIQNYVSYVHIVTAYHISIEVKMMRGSQQVMDRVDSVIKKIGITDRITILKINYGLKILGSEVPKMLLLLIVFILLDKLVEYLFVFIILSPLRSFTGGVHMKTNIACFVFSAAVYFLIILLLPIISIPMLYFYLLLAVSAITMIALAPVHTSKRPIETKERHRFLKKMSVIVVCFGLLILAVTAYVDESELFIIGVWAFVIQAIQLIIGKVLNLKGGKSNDNY